jgi:hypothetical protein
MATLGCAVVGAKAAAARATARRQGGDLRALALAPDGLGRRPCTEDAPCRHIADAALRRGAPRLRALVYARRGARRAGGCECFDHLLARTSRHELPRGSADSHRVGGIVVSDAVGAEGVRGVPSNASAVDVHGAVRGRGRIA